MKNLHRVFNLLLLVLVASLTSFCSKKDEVTETRIIALSGNLNFGQVEIGKSVTKTFTINNTGSSPLSVTGFILPAKFSGSFAGSIPAQGSQIVNITFTPDVVGSFSGIITVQGNQTAGTNTISVAGEGVQLVKSINLVGDLNFGTVTVGESSQKNLTIQNTGTADLVVSGISLPTGFSGNFSGTIAAKGSQVVAITFKPTQATAYSGTVNVAANHSTGTNTLAISGTGTQSPTKIIALLPSTLDFGSIEVNNKAEKTFTIKNTGNSPLTIQSVSVPTGYQSSYNSGTLAADASVEVKITFAPTTVGTFNGNITINSNADSGGNLVSVTGTSVATSTRIIGLSGSLAFGNVETGKTATKVLTITNTGTGNLTVTGLTLPAGFSAAFSGTVNANGGTQLVTITFAPTSAVVYSGNVTVNGNQTSGSNTIAISGTGTTSTVADPLAIYRRIYGATSVTQDGNFVVIKSNGRPDHKSPYYKNTEWESTLYVNDTRAGFNQAPGNKVATSNITFRIPMNPTEATNKQTLGAATIGVALNGVAFFNQYQAQSQLISPNVGEYVSFDLYGGHPTPMNEYHYHIEPNFLTTTKGKDALLGFLLDGFPVYGPLENGTTLTSANLDAYHGHKHATADYPNGIYHYHITADPPYINGNGYFGVAGTWTK